MGFRNKSLKGSNTQTVEGLKQLYDQEMNLIDESIRNLKYVTQDGLQNNIDKGCMNLYHKVVMVVFVVVFVVVLNYHRQQNLKEMVLCKIKTFEVMIPDRAVQDYVAPDFYFFSVSILDMILNSQLHWIYESEHSVSKLSLKQHMSALIRTQLVHNVNFKSQLQIQLSPFDKGIVQKRKAIELIMQEEQAYYEQFYELSRYNKHQLRFCIIVPSFNNVKSMLYKRNLDSIFMQDYNNYHVVYIDDASPDKTGEHVKDYIREKGIPSERVTVLVNSVNKKALYNIYNGIHSYCPDGQIVALIDGDDSLIGRKVLQLYNAVYQNKRTGLVYSNFLKILNNNKTSSGFGYQVTPNYFYSGKLRRDVSLFGTHFMTFFSDIFKKIKKQDLSYQNGTFYDYAYDRAIITPMVEMVFPRVQYLPEFTYQYRNDTGINDGNEDWERVSRIIIAKPVYTKLDSFPFIDNFPFVDSFIQQEQNQDKEESKIPNIQNPNKNPEDLTKTLFSDDDPNK